MKSVVEALERTCEVLETHERTLARVEKVLERLCVDISTTQAMIRDLSVAMVGLNETVQGHLESHDRLARGNRAGSPRIDC
jgi:hypothetical protein